MDLISVWFEDESCRDRAEQLAQRLRLAVSELRPESALCLYVSPDRIAIGFPDEKPFRPYAVDFESPEWRFRHRRGLSENRALLTAVGLKPGWKLLDGNAGFGQDAFVLAWAGAGVTAVERSPIVYELLVDGLNRAFVEHSIWTHTPKIRVLNMDLRELLQSTTEKYDVIYLDPMFDKPKKSAKSPKPMQILQTLLRGESTDVEELLQAALVRAQRRVVLKLPLKARHFFGKPDIVFPGQSIRYDVYSIN